MGKKTLILCKPALSDWRGAYVPLDFIRAGLSRLRQGRIFLKVERRTQTNQNVKLCLKRQFGPETRKP